MQPMNTICHGDCIAVMQSLDADAIDLAFADPPFNIGYRYDVYDDQKEADEYLAWSRTWLTEVYRILKPDGSFWLAIGDEFAAELKILCQSLGFHCRSWVVWYYTFGVNCTQKFTRSHAHLLYFVKDPKRFTFRADDAENRVPSARQLVYADTRADPRGRLPDDTWILRPQDLADGFTPSEDTWYFPRVAGTFKERAGYHGCQMPEQLLGRIIRLCSNERETVLDPFAGSGSTLVVAKKLGRLWLGCDISREYVKRGLERLEAARVGDRLEGAAEPLVSAPKTPPQRPEMVRDGRAARPNAKRPTREKANVPPPPDRDGKSLLLVQRGLRDAFVQVGNGFSLDRVVADPDLNQKLVDRCRRFGLPGDARSWNRMLFRMRKAGLLADIATYQRTKIGWPECDPFLFASEIAWRQVMLTHEEAHSLDDIVCDPALVGAFDQVAASLCPGFSLFHYRWGALKLRKEANAARSRARFLAPFRLGSAISVKQLKSQIVPSGPGVYLISDGDSGKSLYGGQALHLADRLCQAHAANLDHWVVWTNDPAVRVFAADCATPELLAYQSLLIREHKPTLNID